MMASTPNVPAFSSDTLLPPGFVTTTDWAPVAMSPIGPRSTATPPSKVMSGPSIVT
jgi:hypothetical protein